MTRNDSNTLLIERLTRRLAWPGVMNVERLQRWRERSYKSIVLRGLVERLLERTALLAEADGEAMVWARGARGVAVEGSSTIPAPAVPHVSAMNTARTMIAPSALRASASTEKISPLAERAHARLHSAGVARVGEWYLQRPTTTAGVIHVARLTMPLQTRAAGASSGTGATNSAVATSLVGAAFTSGVEWPASGQRLSPSITVDQSSIDRSSIDRSSPMRPLESEASDPAHESDTTSRMPATAMSRGNAPIQPGRESLEALSASRAEVTRVASGAVAGNVSVLEMPLQVASLAMPITQPLPGDSSLSYGGGDPRHDVAYDAGVAPMVRRPAPQIAHSLPALAEERVPNAGTSRPVLLFRKPVDAPVQPEQIQDATQYASGVATAPRSNVAPAQTRSHTLPARAAFDLGRIDAIADAVEQRIAQRLEIAARRRGRAWR